MCGITGFWGGDFNSLDTKAQLTDMCEKIRHRGPNAHDIWVDRDAQIALGHTRLSILDLSSAGTQPMISPSERYVIVFNGEIYNHLALRKKLSPHLSWRGHSDTETLLAAFDEWGLEESVRQAVGMFAFAVWDKKLRTLTLGRDRAGEKPLYYGWQKDVFLFGSELKSLKTHPAFCSHININALSLYMRFNNIPAPYSVWKNIYKLMPGTLYTLSFPDQEGKLVHYWNPLQAAREKKLQTYDGTREEMLIELESLITQSVEQQMMADVPVGAFLSGGIDSSLIVALMQRSSSQKICTYSIGFETKEYNEAGYAAEIAKHIGTKHTELYVSSREAIDVILRLPTIYDEPFADSSQIPTTMVSALAKKDVSVALSGDAGDELFFGYSRYTMTQRLWRYFSKVPLPIREFVCAKLKNLPSEFWGAIYSPLNLMLQKRAKNFNFSAKMQRFLLAASADSITNLYLRLISHHWEPSSVVLNAEESPLFFNIHDEMAGLSDIEKIMFMDFVNYLSNDILTKVDRAAMSVSLETRVPFLDHRIVEFAWSLPLNYKYFNNQTKWPLRQILYKYVPHKLIERPKMGFAIPLGGLLRGPLREWAESLLDESRLQLEGIFNARVVRSIWDSYLKNQSESGVELVWDVLMFQAWINEQCIPY